MGVEVSLLPLGASFDTYHGKLGEATGKCHDDV